MSVYFATCREANAVKIGHSLEPWSRLNDLQIGCPLPMTIEAILPGGFEEEQQYHGRFSEHRIHGEWFRITDIIELVIEQNRVGPITAKPKRTPQPRVRKPKTEPKPAWLREIERAQLRHDARRYVAAMAEMREAGQ